MTQNKEASAEVVYQFRPDGDNWIDCTEKYYSDWNGEKRIVYTTPPTVSAAVAAALRKAAEVCETTRRLDDSDNMARSIQCQIRAIPADETALREMLMRATEVIDKNTCPDGMIECYAADLKEEIINSVMKGE